MAIRLLTNNSQILYHLGRITRDRLNWQTDAGGNVGVVITKVNGRAKDAGTRLIRRLNGYRSIINITITSGGNEQLSHNGTNESNGVGSDSTVNFNPNAAPKIGTLDENTGISRDQDRPSWMDLHTN